MDTTEGGRAVSGSLAPEQGTRVLFFSGGTALNGVARQLKTFTHNTIHLLTTFDSGGSSAMLRDAFGMPAVGDLRSRLLALANESSPEYSAMRALFAQRLTGLASAEDLRARVSAMAAGQHPSILALSPAIRPIVCQQIDTLLRHIPEGFDWRGASIGNLILTGSFLNSERCLVAALRRCGEWLGVQGTVHPTVEEVGHLGAALDDGRVLIGQHLLTGKESPPLDSPIQRLFLSQSFDRFEPGNFILSEASRTLIGKADIVCYPPGSFYSSLIANLLPSGVSAAIAKNGCPKVFVPNLGCDPEQIGMHFDRVLNTLLAHLQYESGEILPRSSVLNYVLVDTARGRYPYKIDVARLEALGLEVLDMPLVTASSAPYYDDRRLAEALLSLAP